MFTISHSTRGARGARAAGFTLIELMVVVIIVGVMLAIGVPRMTAWVVANKAAGATEFYMEGLRLARQQAIGHNAASRFVLAENAVSGQYDWQVDICFPTPVTPCTDVSGVWSSPTAIAPGDPEGAAGFTSVTRSAQVLPKLDALVPDIVPVSASAIYYTSLGWVNTGVNNRITRLVLSPGPKYTNEFQASAVAVTLAGMPTRCNPALAVSDSRACPP